MSLIELKFLPPEVAGYCGLNLETLQSYIKRGFIVAQGERAQIEGGGGRGKQRLFSWYGLVQVALAAELIRADVPPKRAFECAVYFSHVGDDVATLEGEEANPEEHRAVGFPFLNGETYLLAHDSLGRTVRSDDGSLNITLPGNCKPIAFHVVNASTVFDRLCAAIGVHPVAELEKIYQLAIAIR